MSWISELRKLPRRALERTIKMAIQVSCAALAAKLQDQKTVIAALKAAVTTQTAENAALRAQNADLRAQISANNPAAIQADVDAQTGTAGENNTELVTIVEGVPPPIPGDPQQP